MNKLSQQFGKTPKISKSPQICTCGCQRVGSIFGCRSDLRERGYRTRPETSLLHSVDSVPIVDVHGRICDGFAMEGDLILGKVVSGVDGENGENEQDE